MVVSDLPSPLPSHSPSEVMSRGPWRPSRRRNRRLSPPSVVDPRALIEAAADWPLADAWVTEGWREDGAAVVVWTRRHPDRPRFAVVTARLDLTGGGIIDVRVQTELTLGACWTAVDRATTLRKERCGLPVIAGLLSQATEKAAELGSVHHPELGSLKTLLGEASEDWVLEELPVRGNNPTEHSQQLQDRLSRGLGLMRSAVGEG